MNKKAPLEPLYTQVEVDRAKAEHGLALLTEERQRIRAWVMAKLGNSFDGDKVLAALEHDNWPEGSR